MPVAKHGNRALSSKSGAADVLTALGVNIDADMKLVQRALFEVGIGFLMAPRHHSAMRHVGPTRVELGTRTIFNLLGPLSNPAGVKRQLLGVFAADWVEPLAAGAGRPRPRAAWVVHGADGLDELTTTRPTACGGTGRTARCAPSTSTPEDAGLPTRDLEDIEGGDAEDQCARRCAPCWTASQGAFRDIVLLNAAAALIVAGKAEDLKDGVAMAAEAIDSGARQGRAGAAGRDHQRRRG